MPSCARRFTVAGPTPHNALTGNLSKKSITPSGWITMTPIPGIGPDSLGEGLASSVANFAINLFGAIPTEQLRPCSDRISFLIALAISRGVP